MTNEKAPNPADTGIVEAKESIIEWVTRRFGANNEDLKQLNVTSNHSCQEVLPKFLKILPNSMKLITK